MKTPVSKETIWIRYIHRERPDIEFDVECDFAEQPRVYDNGKDRHDEYISGPKYYYSNFRIRTVRNLKLEEEIHQPAYTMMPADRFLEVYERVT